MRHELGRLLKLNDSFLDLALSAQGNCKLTMGLSGVRVEPSGLPQFGRGGIQVTLLERQRAQRLVKPRVARVKMNRFVKLCRSGAEFCHALVYSA